jgi:hypothetical protein
MSTKEVHSSRNYNMKSIMGKASGVPRLFVMLQYIVEGYKPTISSNARGMRVRNPHLAHELGALDHRRFGALGFCLGLNMAMRNRGVSGGAS